MYRDDRFFCRCNATKEQLNKISQVARQGIKDIRRSVNKLRPDALEHSGLQEALEKMINETMQVSDVKINYDCQVEVLKFNQDVKRNCRI